MAIARPASSPPARPKDGEGVEALFGGRAITIRGAREHNLKNVDLAIPRDKLVVFTGLSGSGKSSLAFHKCMRSCLACKPSEPDLLTPVLITGDDGPANRAFVPRTKIEHTVSRCKPGRS